MFKNTKATEVLYRSKKTKQSKKKNSEEDQLQNYVTYSKFSTSKK